MKRIKLLFAFLTLSTVGFSQNRFAFDMFAEMDSNKNILFSPTSIKTAFAMAYEGANNATQSEFEKVFGFKKDNSLFLSEVDSLKKVAEISNSVWILDNYQVLESYLNAMESNFGAKPNYTDFLNDSEGSAKKINDWIEESTKGMLKNIVTAGQVANFKMALVNAIYFKQNWAKPFDKKRTQKWDFTNYDGSKTEADLMRIQSTYSAFNGSSEQVIELPYEGYKTSMIIVLPKEMKGYVINDSTYNQLASRLRTQTVNLNMPKFTFETPTFELKPLLKNLGMITAFENSADFSGMRKENDLKIGTALHKAKIIVNEEGTEAAATTIIGMQAKTTSARPNPVMNMTVDKPFFYFIKDNESGAILFMGRMNNLN